MLFEKGVYVFKSLYISDFTSVKYLCFVDPDSLANPSGSGIDKATQSEQKKNKHADV